ncbi:MAG: type I restriction enzyme HsdR N-terminal domain-containing protein [Proteobacteria bacterium]|nr:type I restriction enzyme HsdR N-terminal domain-containing protein [Pseudomonadota bacterium]
MPKFVTISPTHIPGRKQYAWEKFRDGGYIAIGWMHDDLTGMSMDEIEDAIRSHEFPNEQSALDSFRKFLALSDGDYVAVNNANAGLFGVGIVKSGYKHKNQLHDTGTEDHNEWYSHLREVEWRHTSYAPRRNLVEPGETGWQPYGTVGTLQNDVPLYIRRLLGEPSVRSPIDRVEYVRPDWLEEVIRSVELLQKDPEHKERANESLVEDFLSSLGYAKHRDIRYRQGRVDVTVFADGKPAIVVEVKRDWNLSTYNAQGAIQQAYNYAYERGVRFVVVTNGDNYMFFDRLKGLSYETNLFGEFCLTALQEEDLHVIDRLRPDRIAKIDVKELLQHLSEAF